MIEITAQDRELLAAEYEAAGSRIMAEEIAAGRMEAYGDLYDPRHALRAISKIRSQLEEVTRERDELRQATTFKDSSDRDDECSAAIAAAHPTLTGKHDLYVQAMKMVGNRYSKGALVCLVNWLLAERDREEAAAKREAGFAVHYAQERNDAQNECDRLSSLIRRASEVLPRLMRINVSVDPAAFITAGYAFTASIPSGVIDEAASLHSDILAELEGK
jgi:hypothetical protein